MLRMWRKGNASILLGLKFNTSMMKNQYEVSSKD
jgi:hypothetical protein